MFGFVTCGPNEALVVSGCCHTKPLLVPGGTAFVWPVIQQVQKISLNTMTLTVESPKVYTNQGVAIFVTGVAQLCDKQNTKFMPVGYETYTAKQAIGVEITKKEKEMEYKQIILTAVRPRVNDGLPTEDYSNILSLVDLILSLPVQSAECERVFSNMKLVKSDWRSVLKSKNLSDQLMVILATNDIDQYDPLSAIRLWNSAGSKPRRPCTAPYGVRSCNADLESDNECNSELSDYDDDDTYDDERDI
ncbi:Flotillin-1 [Nymphon striatum]|nr:Flotillin-1 [Nymphon striatum]